MRPTRDSHLRLGMRQTLWLRREQTHRQRFLRELLFRWFLRALTRDAGLPACGRVIAAQRRHQLSRVAAVTRHRTRCFYSGRARQVPRLLCAARMHFRTLAREGQLAGLAPQRA
jgi:ribosomal protein S14